MSHQLWVYDLTIKESQNPKILLITAFKALAKKWVFQEEQGSSGTGYRHYQCRLNLQAKLRATTLYTKLTSLGITGVHISPTSNAGKLGFTYVMKSDTRIAGPYKDSDIPVPTHLNVVEEHKMSWEEQVEQLTFDMRSIHFICDTEGLQGKSTWSLYRHIRHKAIYITAWDEPIQVFQAVYSSVQASPAFSRHEIIIDLPRSRLPQPKLYQLWTILEGIKNGYIQEYRYQHRKAYLGPTRLIVFSNYRLEPGQHLTRDRAHHYTITNQTLFGASL